MESLHLGDENLVPFLFILSLSSVTHPTVIAATKTLTTRTLSVASVRGSQIDRVIIDIVPNNVGNKRARRSDVQTSSTVESRLRWLVHGSFYRNNFDPMTWDLFVAQDDGC